MFQKFNSDSLTTKFIKNIVSTIYLPTIPIWRKGKQLIKDNLYITRDYIVRAKANCSSNDSKSLDVYDSRYFQILQPYIEGSFYPGITTKYESGSSLYDPETHYYLGEYLRLVRDLHNIDLMQYYNCWDGSLTDKIRIVNNNIVKNGNKNDGKKVLLIPIKFNQKYTLYMDCNSEVQIGYIFWDTTNAINLNFMIDGTNIEKYSCLTYTDPQILNGVDMTNPSSDIGFDKKWSEEKYLTMIIQMPSTITSAVLVLEGEYSKNRLLLDYSLPEIFNGENYVTSPSSLTTQSRSNSYAFNDRLLEYLLWNTITSQDKISKNTVRIQNAISSDICSQLNGYKIDRNDLDIGTWTANMKFFIYQLATNTKINKKLIDINGFVDKDTEKIVMRGNNE